MDDRNSPASTRLTNGPAAATRRAPIGVEHSRSTLATPPNRNRVMLRTFTPSCSATSEWPSSCSNTDANRSKAVNNPSNQLSQGPLA
jgi:hypothetical protein